MNQKTKILIGRFVPSFTLFLIIAALLILNIHNQRLTQTSLEILQIQVYVNTEQDLELEDINGHIFEIYGFIDKLQKQDQEHTRAIAAIHLIEETRTRPIEAGR